MSRFFLVGNWKANCGRQQLEKFLTVYGATSPKAGASNLDVLLALPYPYLNLNHHSEQKFKETDLRLCAQAVSSYPEGAYTGEVSAGMLQDLEIPFAIVGHSERRSLLHESPEAIRAQLGALEQHHIRAILCFGEKVKQSSEQTASDIFEDLKLLLSPLSKEYRARLLLAYEPYWAIGSQESASPHEIKEVLNALQEKLRSHFSMFPSYLYGGSVNKNSISALLSDNLCLRGVLVGKASLCAEHFSEIKKMIESHLNIQNQMTSF